MPTGTDKKKSSLIKGTEKAVPSKTENLYIIANLLQPNTSLTCTKKKKQKKIKTNKQNKPVPTLPCQQRPSDESK